MPWQVLMATGTPYATYRDGVSLLSLLIGPATVALAVPLYGQRARIRPMWRPLCIALLVGSAAAIASALLIAWALGGTLETLMSLAPKSATMPIALPVAERMGGLSSLAAVAVAITGIAGTILAGPVLRLPRIHDPAVRGFAVGLTAHAIGTARELQVHPTAGAFAALAKARGCRAVGIAGGAEKCKYAVEELGFDVCIDYKEHSDVRAMSKALKEACPNGIDGYFENVGGWIMDAVMLRMNAFSRIALCGMIAGYDGAPLPMANPALILINRMKIEGFIVSEHMEVWPDALKELGTLVGTGKLRPRETIAQGIAAAPEAFLGLLKGKNFGKQLVKLI